MDDSKTERRRVVESLVAACDEEVGDAARAAVMRSEFARLVTPEIVGEIIDAAQFCRSFALGCADSIALNNRGWTTAVLGRLAEMNLHNGDIEVADVLARECVLCDPHDVDSIATWAESAPNSKETMRRYIAALERAENFSALRRRALQFAERAADKAALIAMLDRSDGGRS